MCACVCVYVCVHVYACVYGVCVCAYVCVRVCVTCDMYVYVSVTCIRFNSHIRVHIKGDADSLEEQESQVAGAD